jgi:hypothetical protein
MGTIRGVCLECNDDIIHTHLLYCFNRASNIKSKGVFIKNDFVLFGDYDGRSNYSTRDDSLVVVKGRVRCHACD